MPGIGHGSYCFGDIQKVSSLVLYYKNVSEEDSGWIFAGWAKETLGKAISEQPMLSGRLWRGKDGDGELEIVSNDSGVRLIETQVAVTLSGFLEMKEKEEAEAQLVFWNDIDEHNPQFSPLFYVQVTNFQCGGYSIGISCSILLADLLVKEKFLTIWANIHNNILSSNNELQKPLFYLPNLKRNGSSPPSITSSTLRKDCVKTMHFKVTAENANLDGETCKSLALHRVEEIESQLGSKMDSEFYLFVKENSKDIIEIEKYPKHKHVKPQLSFKTQSLVQVGMNV
ncbi:anthranilate N-benzoyltransferase protein 1-like [Quercus lobata]|uniref:anthranilate N-benzoyltransferase protein 1-like n=1 Tax=Quercus lobata TaxID=97700 RepID=UPI00124483EE|nr:anthranilate N-benzoyltransferase protein 1-like [Quercus lobata]